MNDKQENKLSMKLGVRAYLVASNALTTGLPGFGAIYHQFSDNIDAIQEIRELQEESQKGYRERKEGFRKVLEEEVMSMALKTGVYAKMNDLPLLANRVNYSRTKLIRAADTILRDMAEVVFNSATEHLAAMADYGVTAANLAKLRSSIDAYLEAIPEPRMGTATTKEATDKLKVLFAENDVLLKKMDLLIALLKDSKLEFYGHYLSLRKIIETNPKKLALVAKVTRRSTGEGIKGAKVSFSLKKAGAESKVIVEKLTGDKGLFNIKSLPDAEYYAVVRKTGFMEKVLTVSIADGDTYKLNVELETETEYDRRMEDERSI